MSLPPEYGTITPAPLTAVGVRAFRVQVGISQVGLARLLGVHRRTVEAWEAKDAPNPPPPYLRFAFAAIAAQLRPWGVQADTEA